MANREKDLRSAVAIQRVSFDIPLKEGALDVTSAFREAVSQTIKNLNISRHQLAAAISELTGREIPKNTLDKYTSDNRNYAFRAEDLPALVASTGSADPINVLFAPIGHMLIGPDDVRLLELAKMRRRREELDARIAAMEREMSDEGGEE